MNWTERTNEPVVVVQTKDGKLSIRIEIIIG